MAYNPTAWTKIVRIASTWTQRTRPSSIWSEVLRLGLGPRVRIASAPTPVGVPAPVFSVVPTVSGTAAVGQTLTATNGTASGTPTYSRQWRRDGSPISGATGTTYVVQAADQGKLITVASAATNAGGVTISVSAPLAIPAALATPAPAFTTQPSFSPTSGTAGTTLFTASDGVASNTTGYTRRWLLNGTAVSTAGFYTPPSDGSLVLEVTATGPGGSTIATTAGVTVAAAGGGGGGVPTLTTLNTGVNAPAYAFTGNTVYPPELVFSLDSTATVGDWLRVIGSASRDLTSPLVTFDRQITTGDATTGPTLTMPVTIASPAQTYFAAFIIRPDGTYSATTLKKHGDTTAPVITTSTAASYVENTPVSHAVSVNEFCTFALGGTDGGLLELTASSGLSTTVRLAGNTSPDYELPAGKRSYSFTITATDDAGLTKTETITWSITNSTSDDPPVVAWSNPGFDTDTVWSKGSGVTISGGKANAVSAGRIVGQQALVVGQAYHVTFDWTRAAANSLRLNNSNTDGANTLFTWFVGDGTPYPNTIAYDFTAADPWLWLEASGDVFTGTIDNFNVTPA